MKFHTLTLEQIHEMFPNHEIDTVDIGVVDGVHCLEVLVWKSSAESQNDDGTNAEERFTIAYVYDTEKG